jgi:lipid A 3-O-deacylase
MKTTTTLRLAAAGLLAGAASLSHAFDWKPDGAALQVGGGSHSSRMAGVGVIWDWDFERMRRKAELTAHTELMVNHWRADAVGGGERGYTQLVLLPSLRMRLSRGRSPWFIELGIGASWMDRLFETPQKSFSTQWNFYDMMGVGHTLGGPDGKHEIGLRWIHVSNGGVKHPNPGQDFLQLRYVARF